MSIKNIDRCIKEINERFPEQYEELCISELTSARTRLINEKRRREFMLKMQGDGFDVYREQYNQMINKVLNNPVALEEFKIGQAKNIIMEEFHGYVTDKKAEQVARRLYEKIIY